MKLIADFPRRPNHAGNVLHVMTVLEKRISGGRKNKGFNLGELDTLKRGLKQGRSRAVHRSYI